MVPFQRSQRAAAGAVILTLVLVAAWWMSNKPFLVCASQAVESPHAIDSVPLPEPLAVALPLAEDRGQAGLEQALKRLATTASLLMIVAHPDDEDGSLLTALARGQGVRSTLFTLTRGEGGQNAMSGEEYDALGLIRTNELLRADQFYGAQQLWGTEVDFGFSKTQEESFAQWGHDRVLYDAVLAVRKTRPQVIVSTFVGAITDGHGQHQVSGEIAQEAFKASGDPNVFPEQLKDGLTAWQPLAVYSMTPFAPVENGRMFDYATGKSAPAKFRNYVSGETSASVPSTDVTIPVGTWDPVLGRSYMQIARQGWGEQKSQNGGANPTLSGPGSTSYHLWGVAPAAAARGASQTAPASLFENSKVHIDTGVEGIARLGGSPPGWLTASLREIGDELGKFEAEQRGQTGLAVARALAPIYRQTLALRERVAASDLIARPKADLLFELDTKIDQFQDALRLALGLDLIAFRTRLGGGGGGPFRGQSADETPRSVAPGEQFKVRVHTAQATRETRLNRVWLVSTTGAAWKNEIGSGAPDASKTEPVADTTFDVRVPEDAEPTAPYFTRPTTEQPYYDLSKPEYRERSFAPYPLSGWAEFSFDGLPIRVGQVVQTLERVTGPGGIYQPLVVTPAIGVSVEPEARILPLDGSALPVRVTVHTQAAAEGTVDLKLPSGWRAEPAEAKFHLAGAGDTEPIMFSVTPDGTGTGAYTVEAVAHSGGRTYASGWHDVSYAGLRPYNLYRPALLKTRKVDVKLAPGLRIGYVMGPGDMVPDAIEGLGAPVHLLTDTELASADLSAWNVIVVGIRAYATRPELEKEQSRLDEFVRQGGTLVVQYQSSTFPAPLPLAIGRFAERVVDENAPVKLLEPANPLLIWPNRITTADFSGWLEERGHGFLDSWDKDYAALTETADPGQDPQRGGLVVAHVGKGTYIYVAFALYRQLPELVPGAYRLMANLLSSGRAPAQ
jgi:LmbE family N-acetylglucosaminyl deacetylase